MGYLDNTGLQYLWNRLKEKFAPKNHTHTKAEVGLGNVDNTADRDKSVSSAGKLVPFIKTTGQVTISNSWFRVARFDLGTINTKWNNTENMWANWTQLRASFLIEGRYAKSGIVNVLAETTGNISVAGQTDPKTYYAKNRIKIQLNCYGIDPLYVDAKAAISNDNHLYVDFWVRNGEYNTTSVYCLGRNEENAISLITNFSISSSVTCPDHTYYACSFLKTSYGDSVTTQDILPVSNNAGSIGTSNNKWNTVFATTFNGKATSAGTADIANSVDWGKIQNKPSEYTPISHTHDDRYYTETEINTKLNGKANSSHTHTKSQITDFPVSLKNPTSLTIQTNGAIAATYDGSAAKTVNITKGNIGLSNVDNTADKDKSVASAAKLTTTRTVSGGTDIVMDFKYDGSGNSIANIGFYGCTASVNNTNNYPYHRFAKIGKITDQYVDKSMLVYISQDYNGGNFGICRLSLRTNGSNDASTVEAKWLIRKGFSPDFIQVAIYNVSGETYADAFIKPTGTWSSVTIKSLFSGRRGSTCRTWDLVDSNEVSGTTATDKKTSSECWNSIDAAGNELHKQAYSASVSATDEGHVASAGSAYSSNSCTGNSASATKLTSSAGSTTQPVYFNDGKPVATTYTLNKTVPADAKFTDTNTWRGIQNNLTSDNTEDSLSAAQGKVLKNLIDKKPDEMKLYPITIPAKGWKSDGSISYPYYIDIQISGIKESDCIAVTISPEDIDVAKAAYFTTTEAKNNVLRLRARKVPAKQISANYYTIREDILMAFGPVSIGGSSYILPPATADTLGGVMIGDGLAVDETGKAALAPAAMTTPTAKALSTKLAGEGLTVDENGKINLKETGALASYPVGSIYQSTQATSPAALFGGTWQEIAQNRVLMGASSAHAAGTTVEAGLPNIKFSFSAAIIGTGHTGSDYRADGCASSNFNLDASKSNAIYGRSSTVQPAAYYVHIWHRVA